MASPGQMATHFSQPSQAWWLKAGTLITPSPETTIEPRGQIDAHGLQGISCMQCSTGKTPVRRSGISSGSVGPGRDFSTSAVRCHSGGTSPTSRPRRRAISSPRMRPVNMAAEASAISSASPAAAAGSPNSSALRRNSFTGSRPTATSTVSHSKRFSVPGMGCQRLSICAMTTASTSSRPSARRMVCDV